MKTLNQIFLTFLFLSIFACGGESTEHKILHQASDIHLEALKIKKELEPNLEQLRQLNNSIQIQGRALTPEEIKFAKEVNALESRLSHWEENHVDVPGFEEEGHDHSGHDHDHAPAFQFPAGDMLIIQKEFKDSIVRIKEKVGTLLLNAPK
jgi:hypothetical protein